MNVQTLSLVLVSQNKLSEPVLLPDSAVPFRTNAVPGGRYLIAQGEKGTGPLGLEAKRSGNNLLLSLPGDENPRLIIQDFYLHDAEVGGLEEDGSYHPYVHAAEDDDRDASQLLGDESAFLIMRPEAGDLGTLILPQGEGINFLKAMAAFAGLLALGGIIYTFHHHHQGKDEPLPAPVIVNASHEDANLTGLMFSGDVTNTPTPQLSGSGSQPGHLIELYDNGEFIGSSAVDENGQWTFTPPALAHGNHVFTAVENNGKGKVSKPSLLFALEIDLLSPDVTLDTVTDAVAGGVSGAISNDGTGLTNDAQPRLSGTAEAGSLVTIYNGTTVIGSVQADADGIWSWQYAGADLFTDGTHTLSVTATDAVGNTSATTAGFVITVDTATAQPTLDSVTDAVVGGVTGNINNDGTGLTNDAQPRLTGTAESGSLVTIYSGTTAIGSELANAAGVWTWQYTGAERFAEGEHLLTVKAVDPAGNISVISDGFTITVDTVMALPTISTVVDAVAGGVSGDISNDGTGLTNDAQPRLTGTAKSGSLVTIYNGTTAIGSELANAAGVWTWQYAGTDRFAEGEHVLTVRTVDAAGNISALSDIFTITVDTLIAQPTLDSVTDAVEGGVVGVIGNDGTGLTNDAQPRLTGTAESGSLITIYSGTTAIGSELANAAGVWTWQYTGAARFAEGEHVLTVKAVDTAGNTSVLSDGFTITVDTVMALPTISTVVDAVAGGVSGDISNDGTGLTNDAQPRLTGTAESGSLVTIYNGTTAIGSELANAAGVWTWQYAGTDRFAEGEHVLTVRAVDAAGNTSALSDGFIITVDTLIAQPTLDSVTDAVAGGVVGVIGNDGTGLTNDAQPRLTGTAESGSLVTIYSGTTAIGSELANAAGVWTWQYTGAARFAEGEHLLTVKVVDPAGNTSVLSDGFTITVDTVMALPTISTVVDAVAGGVTGNIGNDGTGLTNDTRPRLTGTAKSGSLVTIYNGTTAIGSELANAAGVWTWQYAGTDRFAEGEHLLTVKALDTAGNTSALSDIFTITVDTLIGQPTLDTVTDAVEGGVVGVIGNDGIGLTNDAQPRIGGTAEAASWVSIYNGTTLIETVQANAAGVWFWQYSGTERFAEGQHVLTVKAVDAAGNTSVLSDDFTITVDTTPPAAATITAGTDRVGALVETILRDRVTDDPAPEFYGTADPFALVYLYDNDVLLGSFNADESGNWSWILPELLPGQHNLSVATRDAAGNLTVTPGVYPFQVGDVWDFNDGTFNGWTILGEHTRPGETFTRPTDGGGYQLEFITVGAGNYGGDIMSIQIEVEAGKSYDFSFILSRITIYELINPAQLALTVNGVPISSYYTVNDIPQKVEGSWIAPTTGTITLAINNQVSSGNGNDFWIDDIAIAPSELAGTVAPPTFRFMEPDDVVPDTEEQSTDKVAENLEVMGLSLNDVLPDAGLSLFNDSMSSELAASGGEKRTLDLSDIQPEEISEETWNAESALADREGVQHQVFRHSGISQLLNDQGSDDNLN